MIIADAREACAISDNPAWASARPRLSVLIPFFRDDPTALLESLAREAPSARGRVEIVALDDGGGDDALSARAHRAVGSLALPARLLRLGANEGRARGRNRLAAASRAATLLFVDSDMLPDAPDFLGRWLALIDDRDPPAAVGGFSLDQATPGRMHALHAAMQAASECAPAQVRALRPEKYVYTSNLLVRRDVFQSEPFDDGFIGWGWEDVEWGMRVAARFGVVHVDNSATHLGLDTAPALVAKYEQSAGNYARVLARHPEVLKTYASHRAARILRRSPMLSTVRALMKRLALAEAAPLPLRVAALKTYRAALYAEVVG